jgi:hypothetical protein
VPEEWCKNSSIGWRQADSPERSGMLNISKVVGL